MYKYKNRRSKSKICLRNGCLEYWCIGNKAFFGIIYLAGVLKEGILDIYELWNADGTGYLIQIAMSSNRFRFLYRYIRFDNIKDRVERQQFNKLPAIREIFETFAYNCSTSFVPSAFLTVDEQLIAFRGLFIFHQSLQNME